LLEVAAALAKVSGNGSMPAPTIGLIGLRACQITGNTHRLIRAARELRALGESEDRIDALASWWDAPYFTGAERAALALTEAVLQPSAAGEEKVTDELYRDERIQALGARPVALDLLDTAAVRKVVQQFAQTNRLRIEGTDNLLAAARGRRQAAGRTELRPVPVHPPGRVGQDGGRPARPGPAQDRPPDLCRDDARR
jgi:alkylhydroperoxidase family enzyme